MNLFDPRGISLYCTFGLHPLFKTAFWLRDDHYNTKSFISLTLSKRMCSKKHKSDQLFDWTTLPLDLYAPFVKLLTKPDAMTFFACTRYLRQVVLPLFIPDMVFIEQEERPKFWNLIKKFVCRYGHIPPAVTFLIVESAMIHDSIPPSVTVLAFGNQFDQPILDWPPGLKRLCFGRKGGNVIGRLPSGLEELVLGRACTRIHQTLPNSIVNLTLGDSFDQYIVRYPESLTKLTLGYLYNSRLDNLPEGPEVLITGVSFNKSVDKLPQTLKKLTLGNGFTRSIDKLPDGITELTLLSEKYMFPIRKLPKSLETLEIHSLMVRLSDLIPIIPTTLKKLVISNGSTRGDYVPPHLRHVVRLV